MNTYDFRAIEAKWQASWEKNETYRTPNPGDPGFSADKPKYYVLDMFPFPSGKGLHVGHPHGYFATDMMARYKRMRGFNVLHPSGFDSFGLPAEQYAVETGTHPRETTERNIATLRRQLKQLGLSIDWSRELATTDPEFYRWTQWIFLKLYESWFDPSTNSARPIAHLVERLDRDEVRLADGILVDRGAPDFARMAEWSKLSRAEKSHALAEVRLAFVSEQTVNWCPMLGTVLANEEVTNDGRSERGNYPVYRRPLKQWMLRITAYADRLLDDLDTVDWPESVKTMQRNWVGKSHGARVRFEIEGTGDEIDVFTTRPDTLFGATYMVLAPEHPLVEKVATSAQRAAVDAYVSSVVDASDMDRTAETKEKTGVDTGGFAINVVTGERIPIWIADYVLMSYGTGAIMAVPGHDQRDFDFARKFGLPIVTVVRAPDPWLVDAGRDANMTAGVDELRARHERDPSAFDVAFVGEGLSVNSAGAAVSIDGLETPDAQRKITAWLETEGKGAGAVHYKLRDWLFSRQRYWGEPFPIAHGPDGEIVALSEADLPVVLPDLEDFRPSGSEDPDAPPRPPLGRAEASWLNIDIDGTPHQRELNTMPNWAGSCWYYLRFLSPHDHDHLVTPEAEAYWMAPRGVDLYVGGVEHTVLHLLYARFWHKVLFDLGYVSTPEPFGKLINQGYIQAWAYRDERGIPVEAREVVDHGDGTFTHDGKPVTRQLGKIGKSLKNSVSPDEIFESHGCDTLRLFELSLGPLEQAKPWDMRAIAGVHRFLHRVWRNVIDEDTGELLVSDDAASEELTRALHKTIHAVTSDMEGLRYNTAIARLIELNNQLVALDRVPRDVAESLILMLAPLAPHVTEELWERLGHPNSLAYEAWPTCDESYLVDDTITLVVQVMGKKRAEISVAADAGEEELREIALADPKVAKFVEGKTVRKFIHVPGKLVNIVAN